VPHLLVIESPVPGRPQRCGSTGSGGAPTASPPSDVHVPRPVVASCSVTALGGGVLVEQRLARVSLERAKHLAALVMDELLEGLALSRREADKAREGMPVGRCVGQRHPQHRVRQDAPVET